MIIHQAFSINQPTIMKILPFIADFIFSRTNLNKLKEEGS